LQAIPATLTNTPAPNCTALEGWMSLFTRTGAACAALLLAGAAPAATPKDALVMAWNLDALITFDPAQIAEARRSIVDIKHGVIG
jgi:hypothetical protein